MFENPSDLQSASAAGGPECTASCLALLPAPKKPSGDWTQTSIVNPTAHGEIVAKPSTRRIPDKDTNMLRTLQTSSERPMPALTFTDILGEYTTRPPGSQTIFSSKSQ